MQQNETDISVSPKQRRVIEHLAAGRSITRTADEVGVARSTIYRWLKDDYDFQAALNALRRRLRQAAEFRLTCLLDRAIDTVCTSIDDGDARTALAVLKGVGMLSGESPSPRSSDAEVLREESEVQAEEETAELNRRSLLAGFSF